MLRTHLLPALTVDRTSLNVCYHLQHQMLLRYTVRSYKILLEMLCDIGNSKDIAVNNQKILNN
jgi:hypothetical protein